MSEPQFEVNLEVSIRNQFQGPGIQVRETFSIPAMDFGEMAAILGEFHKVAKMIKEARQ